MIFFNEEMKQLFMYARSFSKLNILKIISNYSETFTNLLYAGIIGDS